MSWAVTPTEAVRVFAEPGDATRYDFVVIPDDDRFHVVKINGSPFAESFDGWELRELAVGAPELIGSTYDNYQSAASNNDYVTNTLFPLAAERDRNAWTFLAAALAALKVSS